MQELSLFIYLFSTSAYSQAALCFRYDIMMMMILMLVISVVQEHTKGDYQTALLSLCGGDDWDLHSVSTQFPRRPLGLKYQLTADVLTVFEPFSFFFFIKQITSIFLSSFSFWNKNFSPVCVFAVWSNDGQRATETLGEFNKSLLKSKTVYTRTAETISPLKQLVDWQKIQVKPFWWLKSFYM